MPVWLPPPGTLTPGLSAPGGGSGVSPWAGVGFSWEGADRSLWDFSDDYSPVTLEALTGALERPPHDRFTTSAPGLHGTRQTGTRVLERDSVSMQVRVWDRTGSESFDNLHRAWLRSMSRNTPAYLHVGVRGRHRRLPLYFVGDDVAYIRDPLADTSQRGQQVYSHRFAAPSPFWLGETISRTFTSAGSQQFFMVDGSNIYTGGLFFISEGSTIATATIDNPGEEPGYIRWTINGPCAGITVGVGGYDIEIPIELASDQYVVADTRPDQLTFIDQAGADRVNDIGAAAFAAVPPGESLPLTITATSPGAGFFVRAELTPLYGSAWT